MLNFDPTNVSDEFEASVASLQSAAASLNADCVLLRERVVTADEASGQQQAATSGDQEEKVEKKTGQYLVRQRADEKVRIAVVTNEVSFESVFLNYLSFNYRLDTIFLLTVPVSKNCVLYQ